MAKHMVRECEYRNMCPEIKGCSYYESKKIKEIYERMKISEEDIANYLQNKQ
jgi:hypothetical protein